MTCIWDLRFFVRRSAPRTERERADRTLEKMREDRRGWIDARFADAFLPGFVDTVVDIVPLLDAGEDHGMVSMRVFFVDAVPDETPNDVLRRLVPESNDPHIRVFRHDP